jgi:hypothetical protein
MKKRRKRVSNDGYEEIAEMIQSLVSAAPLQLQRGVPYNHLRDKCSPSEVC